MKFHLTIFLLFLIRLAESQNAINHFIYFGNDREKINESLFLHCKNASGAQIRYDDSTLVIGLGLAATAVNCLRRVNLRDGQNRTSFAILTPTIRARHPRVAPMEQAAGGA